MKVPDCGNVVWKRVELGGDWPALCIFKAQLITLSRLMKATSSRNLVFL